MSKEGKGSAFSTSTSSSSNPVNIILETCWEVIVYHTFYIFYICSTDQTRVITIKYIEVGTYRKSLKEEKNASRPYPCTTNRTSDSYFFSYFLFPFLLLNDPRTYNECSSSNCALHDSAGISTSTTQPPS